MSRFILNGIYKKILPHLNAKEKAEIEPHKNDIMGFKIALDKVLAKKKAKAEKLKIAE